MRVLKSPDLKDKFANNRLEVVASSPEELVAMRKADVARVTKVIKAAEIPINK